MGLYRPRMTAVDGLRSRERRLRFSVAEKPLQARSGGHRGPAVGNIVPSNGRIKR